MDNLNSPNGVAEGRWLLIGYFDGANGSARDIRGRPFRLVSFAWEDSVAVDGFQNIKIGDFEVQDWGISGYLGYLNNWASGKCIVKTLDLCDQKTVP